MPLREAELAVTELADPVVTVGFCTAAIVTKLMIAPVVVPELFWATTSK